MSNLISLDQIKTICRERSDMENNPFIGESELTSYINSSYAELYDLLVSAYEDYFIKEDIISVLDGVNSYNLPDDFYKLRAVDVRYNSSKWRALSRFNWNERNRDSDIGAWGSLYHRNAKYRVTAEKLLLTPVPSGSSDLRLTYIPCYTKLVAGSDNLSKFVSNNAWEEYIINDVCAKMLAKEESDNRDFLIRKEQIKERINTMAQNRDANESYSVIDIYETDDPWGYND